MATKKAKAFAYLRVSGKSQVRGHGYTRQRKTIDQYAKRKRIDIIDEYRDAGVSGTKELEDREGLADLLTEIRANGVRVVLVERADRLARDLVVGELILKQFRDLGVAVIAADSGTDLTVGSDDPTGILIRQVLGAVAQFEKSVIVQKLRAARAKKRRTTGRCEGRKPYGSRPGEKNVLDLMFRLRQAKHLSFGRIADELNERGIHSRTGKSWRPSAVQTIIGRGRPKARKRG